MLHSKIAELLKTNTQNDVVDMVYQSRKNRNSDPVGSFDRQGRFYLGEEEVCSCCSAIRTPSKAYPYSELTHARTKKHVTNLVEAIANN